MDCLDDAIYNAIVPGDFGFGKPSQNRRPGMSAIRIEDVHYDYVDFRYRTAMKFGGVSVDRVTLVNVSCRVRTQSGSTAVGFGSMPLGNVWAFPSRTLPYEKTLAAMKAQVAQVAAVLGHYQDFCHPIDMACDLEPAYRSAAREVGRQLLGGEPIPPLAALVCASPFDAAVHDAFGKVHGLNCYETYGRDFVPHDLGHYLGSAYRGLHLEDFLDRRPRPTLPVNHTVGALDPLDRGDLAARLDDGLPETLAEWIASDGLTHFKIKLNGDDMAWDVDRIAAVERVVAADKRLGGRNWHYSLDFNERCPGVAYLLEFLARLRDCCPHGYSRIQYIEQPTARELPASAGNDLHEAARLCPVVVDEGLTDLESLRLAQEMGYSGVALKACKGQSQSLLMAAAARQAGMFLCVQDLTCPGAALIHSAALAAHVPGVAAIEANARQYVPAANAAWEERFSGIFRIKNGVMTTGQLTGPGLGAVQ
jgi:L-alanine-DL-glutamate epimerase-like enolase superfamily enzyme